MIRCAVIQLARLGDLAQSVPLLQALGESGRHVTLFCAADPGEWIRQCVSELRLVDLRQAGRLAGDPVALFRLLEGLAGKPGGPGFEEGICLNEATPATGLMQLLQPGRVWGFGNEEHPAVAWLRVLPRHRAENRVHLSEWQLALRPELEAGVTACRTKAVGPVIVHTGSGHPARRLDESFWNRLLRELERLMPQAEVLLSGSEREALFCRRLAERHARVRSLAGRTNLDQLLEVIAGARLLVAQDTGVLHLGTLTDTPLLGLYHGSARAWETGPFQHGARVLEIVADCHPCAEGQPPCGDFACRNSLDPLRVAAEAKALAEGDTPPPAGEQELRGYDVDLSRGLYLLQPKEGMPEEEITAKRNQLEQVQGKTPFALPGITETALRDALGRGLGFAGLQERFGLPAPTGLAEEARHREASRRLWPEQTA